MCPNCGSCFSKKSNLYNHLHRGKGCPKRDDKDSPVVPVVVPKKESNNVKIKREKELKYAEVKDEFDESDEELSDLVIDDRNQSEIIENTDTVTETEDDLEDDEVEERVEESYVEVQEPIHSLRQNRLEFLQANRDLLRPRGWNQPESSDSKSTPSPPRTSAPLNNLHLLADIAMAHTQYSSDTGSNSDQETGGQEPDTEAAGPPTTMATPTTVRLATPPLNLSKTVTSSNTIMVTKSPVAMASTTPINGYRDIKPGLLTTASGHLKPGVQLSGGQPGGHLKPGVQLAGGQPVQILQPGSNGVIQMIPVQTSTRPSIQPVMTVQTGTGSVQPVMMIQSNGGHPGVIQLPNQVIALANPRSHQGSTSLFSTSMGRLV